MRILLASATLAFAAASQAVGFDDIKIWAGTGSNRAAFVADWNDGKGPESLVWGYRWDGTATGKDMLDAILAADSRLFAATAYNGGVLFGLGYDLDGDGGGYAVGTLGNDNGQANDADDHYREGWSNGYWSYYVAENTTTLPTTWSFSGKNIGNRQLKDGSWDGWTFDAGFKGAVVGTPFPATPVPEPATLAALGLGIALLRRRRP